MSKILFFEKCAMKQKSNHNIREWNLQLNAYIRNGAL